MMFLLLQYHSDMENLSACLNQQNKKNCAVNGTIITNHNNTRSSLILSIQRESRQLQALQRENRDLRLALEDYQNALELIMSKYRDQVTSLIQTNRLEVLANGITNGQRSCSCRGKGSTDGQSPSVIVNGGNNGGTPPQPNKAQQSNCQTVVRNPKASTSCTPKNSSPSTSSGKDKNSSPSLKCNRPPLFPNLIHPVHQQQTRLLSLQQDKIMEMAAVMMKAVDLDDSTVIHDQELVAQLRQENQGLRELLSIARNNGDFIGERKLSVKLATRDKEIQTEGEEFDNSTQTSS